MEHQPLRIRLLGTFSLSAGAVPLPTLHAPRLQALMAYLLLHRDAPQPRRQIAFALWPDSVEAQALTNLRNLVYQLRHALPCAGDCLDNGGSTIQWRAGAYDSLDIADFEQALARAGTLEHEGRPDELRAALEAALAAYPGDLCPTCYDEWIVPIRERLRQSHLAALTRLVTLLEAQRDYPAAIDQAQRLVELEPLHEAAYLQLLRLHALNGDRAAALATYHACAATIQRELAVAPGKPLREAYARVRDEPAPSLPALDPCPLPALVGRHAEWHRLLAVWRAAASGQPQLLLIRGEAGMGKTRLAEEALQWLARQGYPTVRSACYPGAATLPYAPLVAWLRTPPVRAALMNLAPIWLAELSRLLPELCEIRSDLQPAEALSEPWQRQRLFEALRRALLAVGPPLLLLIDDLQWCDQNSLDWLAYLLHAETPLPLLLLGTVRPEELEPGAALDDLSMVLAGRGQATAIDLVPLEPGETAALAAQLTGQAIAAAQAMALHAQSEGNPLFLSELLNAGTANPLPARVEAVLARRLALLTPAARELAGIAAAIGRNFNLTALARVWGDQDEAALLRGLDELLQRRIVREQPDGGYDFSHTLLCEATYSRLSRARRDALRRKLDAVLN